MLRSEDSPDVRPELSFRKATSSAKRIGRSDRGTIYRASNTDTGEVRETEAALLPRK